LNVPNKKLEGLFASNDISNSSVPHRFSNDELLNEYKQQQSSERGFRFLKDPLFFASSIFVKTARRVATLAMIMALCLLVYTIGQRMLRKNLEEAEESLHNQLGKPTQRPTLRGIFQCFQAVHVIWSNGVQVISNLTSARKKVLKYFSLACQKYYLIGNRTECLPI
jgi:transposase